MGFDYSIVYQLPSLKWVKTDNAILPDDLPFERQSRVFAVYSTFSYIKLFLECYHVYPFDRIPTKLTL